MKLKEIVPYEKSSDIEKGLVQKHGSQTYGPGTFGIEIEFTPEKDIEDRIVEEIDPDILVDIVERYGGRRGFENAYVDWIYEQRRLLNRRTWGRGWDDTYGPPDDDQWIEMHPKPEPETDEEGNETEEHRDWVSNKSDAHWYYDRWERSDSGDYKTDFVISLKGGIFEYIDASSVVDMIRAHYLRQYPDIADATKAVAQDNIRDVSDFLTQQLGQLVGQNPDVRHWEVGMDGDNVEIRSRHLTKEDFPLIDKLFTFLDSQGYNMNPDTSAHIHVGVPKDFDNFSLVAMMTLVDEKAVKQDVGQRSLEGWAKLRHVFEKKVADKIATLLTDNNKTSVRFTEEKLKEFLNVTAEKFSGTNIRSFWYHNTIEFRYFGSNIQHVTTLISWIKYFMLLPIVAKTRTEVKVGQVYFRKLEDKTILATLDRNIKIEPQSPEQQKYIDKLRAKRHNMSNAV